MKGQRHKARKVAVQALYQWDMTGQGANEILSSIPSPEKLGEAEQEYIDAIVSEIPRRVDEIDSQFKPHIVRAVGSLDPVEKAILRIATWELMFRPEIPWRVVIDEAIELSKTFGSDQSYRFINGVLDKVAHETRKAETAQA
ncbi:MAG: transcription antitermination factor NusB [Gammaproteobacteria bacterium]|nr:MAG: transcription antitermination factor NusB [Gammaproteobacteria bacterium]RTZ60440.1 MAG: transcription antitermination factor NusB [Gammaproteobacteria bacterium]